MDELSHADVLFANNANGTMAPERVQCAAGFELDEQLANLGKRLKPGARVVVLDRLPALDAAVQGGAFSLETFVDTSHAPHEQQPQQQVSWSQKPCPVFVYTKRKETWACARCTFENPLYDNFKFLTHCAVCPSELRAKFGLCGDLDQRKSTRRAAKHRSH